MFKACGYSGLALGLAVFYYGVNGELFFKLEEEENAALLLHLPGLFAEAAVFGSGSGFGCWQVVATVQAAVYGNILSTRATKI